VKFVEAGKHLKSFLENLLTQGREFQNIKSGVLDSSVKWTVWIQSCLTTHKHGRSIRNCFLTLLRYRQHRTCNIYT